MKTQIPTQSQYETNELINLSRQLKSIEHAPLPDRQEGREDFHKAMKNVELITERIDWLLAGNYGYGAMMRAKEIKSNLRCNRVAQLSQLIAALEWHCPGEFARQAYKRLSQEQAMKLSLAIELDLAREDS